MVPAITMIALLSCVTYLHLAKVPDFPNQFDRLLGIDKLIHAMMFAVLSLFALRCNQFYNYTVVLVTGLTVTLLALYAFSMEFLQERLTVYRTFEWGDLLADWVGIFLGIRFFKKRLLVFFFEHKIWKSV